MSRTPPDDERRAFGAAVAALLRADLRVGKVELRPDELVLDVEQPDGRNLIVYLENYYLESNHLPPGEREVSVARKLAAGLRPEDGPETWADAAARVLPVIRGQGFFLLPRDARQAPPLATQPFVPYLDLALVLDAPDRMSYVATEKLAEWDTHIGDVLVHAMGNASRLPPPVPGDEDGTFVVDARDTYESSRLAVPGLLASFSGRVDGRPIAIIPTRSWCWIAGEADPDRVQAFAEIADREYSASNRALSPSVYTVDASGEVVPLVLSTDHPAANAVRLGHVKLALNAYAEQKAWLDDAHEHDGLDLFVASLNGTLRPDGLPVTWTLWGEDLDTLLPVADLIRIMGEPPDGGPGSGFFVPFHRVVEIVGEGFVPAPGYRPVRYRVHRHPAPRVMELLAAAAIEMDDYEPS